LIVNTASKCGFTPQYDGLQKIYEELGSEGLVVLGFPCDQFAHQEPGDDTQIEEFCSINYGVNFPLSTKVDVNGSKTHPVFKFLKKNAGGMLGSAVKWNFTKFLVSPDGTTVQRFSPTTKPQDLKPEVLKLLNEKE
jgi:glutathione peroxidase